MKTTITIDLENGEVLDPTTTVADLFLSTKSQSNGLAQQSQASADPIADFKAKFGWPAPPVIVLKRDDSNFDGDKDLVKGTQLYRWDKEHNNGTGQLGAWVLKQQ